MDSAHNSNQLSHGNDNLNNDFLSGIRNFADSNDSQNDFHQYFSPELFQQQGQDLGNGMQSESQSQPQSQPQRHQSQPQHQQSYYPTSSIGQQSTGRSQSPAMPAFNQSSQYSQHQQQYSQPLYGHTYAQGAYDPRLYQQRSSNSPASFEQYGYPNQYAGQAHQMNMQSQPSQSPFSQFAARPPSWGQYPSYDARNPNPTLPQAMDPDLVKFSNMQYSNHSPHNSYVDPSFLDGSQHNQFSAMHTQKPQQSQSGLHYPTLLSGQTQQAQMQQPQHSAQQTMQHMTIPQHGSSLQQMVPNVSAMAPVSNLPMKKARGRPRKDASAKAGSVTTDSDSELDIVDEVPEPAPAIIAVSAPTDPPSKAYFDAVKAVWQPRNKPADTAKTKIGISQFGEVVRGLRDQWKTRNDILKKAEADQSPTAADAPSLRQQTAHYRQTMETLVTKTVTFGHQAVLKSLGEIPYTLSALYSFMLDRVSAADYDSSLLLAILKLAEKFTLDEEKLESSKWNKLLQRVAKKGTGEGKTLAEKVLLNAKKQTAKKAEAAKSDSKGNGDLAAGVKRNREGETNGPAAKKVVRAASKPLALQQAEKKRAEAAEAAKKAKVTATTATGGTLVTPAAAKPKAPIKPTTTPFALMSASKKPGTSNAERAAIIKAKDASAPAIQQVKREPASRDSPPASAATLATGTKSASLFDSLFSTIDKKEEVKPKEEEAIPGETPEQKSKRMRKESRRKLRVSWKADDDLVETRFFTHDPDEEINQGDSAKRDAGDTGKEGEMLKRHQGMEDLDDDEDEVDPDFDPDCYSTPTEVDLSGLASEENDPTTNGIKHGGTLVPESKSKDAQDTFEQGVLMVFYSETERPDSPKEPPEGGDDDDFNPSDDFGEPEEKVRKREQDVYARRNPQAMQLDGVPSFASTLQSLSGVQPQQQQAAPQADIMSIIAQLKQNQASQPAPVIAPPPQPAFPPQQFDPAMLQSLMASLAQPQANAGLPQPTPLPPPFNFSTGANAVSATGGLSDEYGSGKRGKNGNRNGKQAKGAVPLDENGLPLNYKTRTCEFWEKNMCTKGDSCTFKHSY